VRKVQPKLPMKWVNFGRHFLCLADILHLVQDRKLPTIPWLNLSSASGSALILSELLPLLWLMPVVPPPPVSGMLSAALLFLYFSGGRDRTMTWDIHRNEKPLY
jgi:hypothetical protein